MLRETPMWLNVIAFILWALGFLSALVIAFVVMVNCPISIWGAAFAAASWNLWLTDKHS